MENRPRKEEEPDKKPSRGRDDEPDRDPAGEPIPAEPREAQWNIFYVILVALLIVSLIIILGIVNFGAIVNGTIFVITFILLVVAVIHWLGAF